MKEHSFMVSVIGGHKCEGGTAELAESIGRTVARAGAVLICGGLGGIMEAVCRGAKKEGGLTVGIIPGESKEDANDYVDIAIPTGMGYSRNMLVAQSADMVIALPGEYGTLTEIGAALNASKKVYGFGTWDIPGVEKLDSTARLAEEIERLKGGV